ncbi:MAG: DEAD/DEAH box helicase, partial [Candidatus Dormibacteria bacterium]
MSAGQRVSAIPEPIPQLWDAILDDPRIQELIVLDRELPPQPARTLPFPLALHDVVRDALVARGITDLYSHQAEAVGAALAGEDVAVVTPTASGKSLCYLLPVLDAVARDPDATAILLYPTKALAQDQYQAVRSLSAAAGIELRTFTYDGDTPPG